MVSGRGLSKIHAYMGEWWVVEEVERDAWTNSDETRPRHACSAGFLRPGTDVQT
jgi:hypothetical protein